MEHVKRMEVELSELKSKHNALADFCASNPKFNQLTEQQRALMQEQEVLMSQYAETLKRRILLEYNLATIA